MTVKKNTTIAKQLAQQAAANVGMPVKPVKPKTKTGKTTSKKGK
jgi:hypothetical protein